MMRFGLDRYFRSVGAEWVKGEGSLNNSVSQLVNVRNPLKFIFEEKFSLSLPLSLSLSSFKKGIRIAHSWIPQGFLSPLPMIGRLASHDAHTPLSFKEKFPFFLIIDSSSFPPSSFWLCADQKNANSTLASSSPLSRRVCGGGWPWIFWEHYTFGQEGERGEEGSQTEVDSSLNQLSHTHSRGGWMDFDNNSLPFAKCQIYSFFLFPIGVCAIFQKIFWFWRRNSVGEFLTPWWNMMNPLLLSFPVC